MAASNSLEEKTPMFVIGRSAKSRCFKHVQNRPCRYRAPKKTCMNVKIFEKWVRELDRKFKRQGRKDCPAHLEIKGLRSIDLQLPPNIKYCTQPMDQRVIKYVVFVGNKFFLEFFFIFHHDSELELRRNCLIFPTSYEIPVIVLNPFETKSDFKGIMPT